MITKIKNGKLILPDGICEKNIYFEDGKITAITNENLPFDEEYDANGDYVSPGFIDIHVHGGNGYEFVDGTREAVIEATNIHAERGTTTIFPTISAYDYEKTANALDAITEYKNDKDILADIPGAHLEGPYFSPKQGGAQDPKYIRTPDKAEYEKLYSEYSAIISRWSYAPELPGADEFLDFLNEKNIVAAAAHTDAEYSHVKKAFDNGMRLITHLYSATSTIIRRDGFRVLGVIESAYLLDDMDVETIADGCHLPPELLKLVFKGKGEEHMCLVTDAIRHGGMTDIENATCQNGNMPYIIEDGVAKLQDRSAFAGSIATTDVLVRTCVKKAGIPLVSAVNMITRNPARIMKLTDRGELREGLRADILVFDEDINIKKIWRA